MTKQELFKKYHINESHNKWEPPDEWYHIDVYLEMGGDENGESYRWIVDFLDRFNSDFKWAAEIKRRKGTPQWGSLYLTAKRMVYRFADEILKELNNVAVE